MSGKVIFRGMHVTVEAGPGIPCEKPPWNSMEFRGFPWKILHGIPSRIRTSIFMEFHGNFSIDFHGKDLHGGLGHFPWNSMENIRAPISIKKTLMFLV